MNKVDKQYFDWLCDIVSTGEHKYDELLNALYHTEFIAEYTMDENRAEDGLDLRDQFGKDESYTSSELNDIHDYCSMLEMMIALAIRMEEDIMTNLAYGDRTGVWFWNMVRSLGVGRMTNSRFNQRKFDAIMDAFMNHVYESDGHGGLFIVDCYYDLTKEEIWTQMNWYLNTLEE